MIDLLQKITLFNFLLFTGLIWYHRKKLDDAILVFSFFLLGKGITLMSNLLLDGSFFPGNKFAYTLGILLNSFLFFYAPFLYWFALNIVKSAVTIKKFSLHFVPFFIFALLNIGVFVFLVTGNHGPEFKNFLWFRNAFQMLYFFQVVAYTGISFWTVYKAESKSQGFDKMLKWLKQVLLIFIAIWFLFLTSSIFQSNTMVSDTLTAIGVLFLLILSNVTVFLMLGSPEVFYNNLFVRLKKGPNMGAINKENYDELCGLVASEQLYKNADLKIGDLSEALNQSPRNVSALINNFYKGNFYDFINYYRIEEAKSLLKNGEGDMTILTILYESGFNNKSVFNAVFKKMVGETPSSFRKNHITKLYG